MNSELDKIENPDIRKAIEDYDSKTDEELEQGYKVSLGRQSKAKGNDKKDWKIVSKILLDEIHRNTEEDL